MELLSHIGEMIECGDGVERLVVPLVLILSADYEEQYGPVSLIFSYLILDLDVLWHLSEVLTQTTPAQDAKFPIIFSLTLLSVTKPELLRLWKRF